MSDLGLVLLLFGTLFAMLLAGFPVAFTLGGVAFVFALFTFGLDFGVLPSRIFGIMKNEYLIAVAPFIFMGVMLEKSGLAEDLLETMALLFGRIRGGLAISVVVVGTLLAASTGIVGATVVTMGLLSLPTMLKRGYSAELATGTISASGTLGQIIPPSIVLILLATALEEPVGRMFMAAVVPGIMLVGLYLLWLVSAAMFKPSSAPAMPPEELAEFHGLAMIKRVLGAFIAPVILMVAVLGSIFAGVATPTEAAAVGAMGATLLTVVQRRFTFDCLRRVTGETTMLTSMVYVILIGATAFSEVFRELNGDIVLAELIDQFDLSGMRFLAVVMVVVFIAGFFLDFIEITFILVPIIQPILDREGIDLTWVGILLALNLQTSFMTPPFGFSLFYLKGVAPPEVKTSQIYRGIVPFIIIQLIALGLVLKFPDLALWLTRSDAAGP
ncbi:MAG: TRAP transporter large permease subunit [Lentisphaeria bacterium]|jgi:tripartite ATP-independent transporter DctM subunit|nr:TRAP transporter large permease subunit [Lentisphaeria bacterium]MDP7740251.1 TRAP transporter large permease subunit [Lentisphaeria bacterium]